MSDEHDPDLRSSVDPKHEDNQFVKVKIFCNESNKDASKPFMYRVHKFHKLAFLTKKLKKDLKIEADRTITFFAVDKTKTKSSLVPSSPIGILHEKYKDENSVLQLVIFYNDTLGSY